VKNPHIDLLEAAVKQLSLLERKVVFVGGASVSLHLDDRAVTVRHTRDIDFVVEATSYTETASIEEELRGLGFTQNPMNGDEPICRWHKEGLIFDMMPTDPTVLGFSESEWFERGFERAREYSLPSGEKIWAFDVLHLLAAKIEAYRDRGDNDWLSSRDVEDIVTVLDGRSSIFEELEGQHSVQLFIQGWLFSFSSEELRDILGGHTADYARGNYLYERLIELRPDSW
jgi:predicted nucleotidyltransferase